jgi:hypothetical protein
LPEGVEALVGIFMPCVGERSIDHGRFELGRSQGTLHEPGMHAGFKQMGGVRMPEGMDGSPHFGNTRTVFGGTAGALDAGATHGGSRCRTVLVIAPGGGKEPGLVTMGLPGGA